MNKLQALPPQITVFQGTRCVARGTPAEVALALHDRGAPPDGSGYLLSDDTTGSVIDLDLSGNRAAIAARYAPPAPDDDAIPEPDPTPAARPRGRPKLGVVAREVTLLPRHWDWLAQQRGGASASLRRLIDAARKAENAGGGATRRDAAYRFIASIAGDLPGFEDASRALFAGDREGFAARIADWPADIRTHALRLLD